VLGSGDGGAYSTVADVSALWRAVFAGRVVPSARVVEMVRPRSDAPDESRRYGLGFWLHPTSDIVMLVGGDAGVAFRTTHRPSTGTTATVVANTSRLAWPLATALDALVGH
jgi:hypothetical protein